MRWAPLLIALVALAVVPSASPEQASSKIRRLPAGFLDAGGAHTCVVLTTRPCGAGGTERTARSGTETRTGSATTRRRARSARSTSASGGRQSRSRPATSTRAPCSTTAASAAGAAASTARSATVTRRRSETTRPRPRSAPWTSARAGRRSRSRRASRSPARYSTTEGCAAGDTEPTDGWDTGRRRRRRRRDAGLRRADQPRRGTEGRRDQRRRPPRLRHPRQRESPLLGLQPVRPARQRQHEQRGRQRDSRLRRAGRARCRTEGTRDQRRRVPHVRAPRQRPRPLLGLGLTRSGRLREHGHDRG